MCFCYRRLCPRSTGGHIVGRHRRTTPSDDILNSGGPHANGTKPCTPASKEKLSELDEAIQAMWSPADKKEIDGILEWAQKIKRKDLPTGTKIVGCSVNRKIKRDGTCKTRICAQGFSQIWGTHYDRTHSPCIGHSSMRCLISLAACINANIDFCDFTQAYTQSELEPSEYIYMKPPPGQDTDADGDEIVWLITRSLYGMKQSGRNWYLRLRTWLTDKQGFEPSYADPCVFLKKTANGMIMLGVYVDDLLIVHTDRDARDAFVSKMAKEFDFTDQGTLTEVLGIEIKQTESDITLCHTKYIEKLAETFLKGEANRKEHKTPACHELRELVETATDSKAPVDPDVVALYRSLVGSLLYTAMTVRPDVSYAVGMLSRALNCPNERLLDEAKRVLYYLAVTHPRTLWSFRTTGG